MNGKKVKEPLFHISRRSVISRWKAWGIRLIGILVALVVCGIVVGVGRGASGILLGHETRQPARRTRARTVRIQSGLQVADFVAEGIQDHARMVAVGAHPGAHVALMPNVEDVGVAVLALARASGRAPLVEHLVLHQNPQLVAQLQKPFVRRIVRGADGVHARLLEEKEPPLLRRAVPRRA